MNKYSNGETIFDLEERTTIFSENIIGACRLMEGGVTVSPLIGQLIRSATSIGANYAEANGASSKKDFTNKIYICKKEAKETLYWIRLIGKSTSNNTVKEKLREIWKEAHELMLIFASISTKLKKSLTIK